MWTNVLLMQIIVKIRAEKSGKKSTSTSCKFLGCSSLRILKGTVLDINLQEVQLLSAGKT